MKKLLVCVILSMGIGCQTQSETSKQDAPTSDQGAAQAKAAPAPVADAQVVTPGVGIGPFKLGDTREAVMAAMPDLVQFEQGSDLRLVNKGEQRYLLTFDEQGKLAAIKLSLLQASATLAGGEGAAVSSATPPDQILAALGCEALVERRGGASAACGAGTSFVLEGPVNAPSIIVFTPPPAPAVP